MTNVSHGELLTILADWFGPADLSLLQLEQVSGGLSGALLWKITADTKSFCLRYTQLGSADRFGDLRRIHELIEYLVDQGFRAVPLPKRTLNNQPFIERRGGIWELTTWLPGQVTSHPTREQAMAATDALARFHLLGATYSGPLQGNAFGVKRRLEVLDELHAGSLRTIHARVEQAAPSATRDVALVIIPLLASLLPKAVQTLHLARPKVPLQWCLLDCHIGNFLFDGDRVSGLVDFALACVGSVSQDVARLVGSIPPEDLNKWQECLASYQSRRPLTADELLLVYAFHLSGTVARAANWLRWQFGDGLPRIGADTAHARLLELATMLRSLNDHNEAYSVFFSSNSQL